MNLPSRPATSLLHQYRTVRKLGQGSFGAVELVEDVETAQRWVRKRVPLAALDHGARQAALLEARLLANVKHPCIVGYRESAVIDEEMDGRKSADQIENPVLVIIMEHCEGGDMTAYLRSLKHPPSQSKIMEWVGQLALALSFLHSRQFVHRDIKPGNVFLDAHGCLKLGDFGVSKMLGKSNNMAHTVIGSPAYLSPEICEGKPYNTASDIWSLGATVYEFATLKRPFEGQTLAVLVSRIVRGKAPNIPPIFGQQLRWIVKACMAQDPDKRPTAAQILTLSLIVNELEKCLPNWKEYRTAPTTLTQSLKNSSVHTISSSDAATAVSKTAESFTSTIPPLPASAVSKLDENHSEIIDESNDADASSDHNTSSQNLENTAQKMAFYMDMSAVMHDLEALMIPEDESLKSQQQHMVRRKSNEKKCHDDGLQCRPPIETPQQSKPSHSKQQFPNGAVSTVSSVSPPQFAFVQQQDKKKLEMKEWKQQRAHAKQAAADAERLNRLIHKRRMIEIKHRVGNPEPSTFDNIQQHQRSVAKLPLRDVFNSPPRLRRSSYRDSSESVKRDSSSLAANGNKRKDNVAPKLSRPSEAAGFNKHKLHSKVGKPSSRHAQPGSGILLAAPSKSSSIESSNPTTPSSSKSASHLSRKSAPSSIEQMRQDRKLAKRRARELDFELVLSESDSRRMSASIVSSPSAVVLQSTEQSNALSNRAHPSIEEQPAPCLEPSPLNGGCLPTPNLSSANDTNDALPNHSNLSSSPASPPTSVRSNSRGVDADQLRRLEAQIEGTRRLCIEWLTEPTFARVCEYLCRHCSALDLSVDLDLSSPEHAELRTLLGDGSTEATAQHRPKVLRHVQRLVYVQGVFDRQQRKHKLQHPLH